ncbi:response regulator transcription factor [Domibacillus iocasae]|uniref:DNA-binding response regulator n=1 Tax=Domibacillus iocasae TaxID=1714016 RepID=A0A1E7DL78_9BACI|nr:response regulator transcription factor [Domibacillus iocasae]OES43428.1 DNA-binding response regulator [Domibacillus iocasae]
MKKTILIVDDEWKMRNLLAIHLKKEYDITECTSGKEAVLLIQKRTFDLILLDVMMPDMDGWETCRTIRASQATPILMLTARNEVKDKVRGLDIGADDYLVKPFDPEELLARVKALLRRADVQTTLSEDSPITFGNGFFSINRQSYEVFVNGERLDLTPKEYEFIETIALSPKRVFTRDMLLDRLWGFADRRDTRTVDSHVKNIRTKIREAGSLYDPIQTVWGVGYKFQEPDQQL